MKMHIYLTKTVFVIALASMGFTAFSQTIWDGPYVTFEKESNADWTLEENQDRITDLVWITRKNNQGIFNIAVEGGYIMNVSPSGTEWAMGSTDDLAALDFSDWREAVNGNPLSSVDQEMVMHLIEEDIYIDLTFQNWQQLSGGAFTYKRRSEGVLSSLNQSSPNSAIIFPNPSQDHLKLTESIGIITYAIFNAKGELISEGEWDTNQALDISALEVGVFTLHSDFQIFRFVKSVE